MQVLFFLFLVPLFLFSSTLDPEVIILDQDTQLIHDIVDPISGGLVYSSDDFILRGVEPIIIRRSYETKGENLNVDGGWLLFPDLELYCKKLQLEPVQLFVCMKDGRGFIFNRRKVEGRNCLYTPEIRTKDNTHSDIYRNTLDGVLSARTSPFNMHILFTNEEEATLTLGDGTIKIYKYRRKNKRYLLEEEIKPNQNHIFYEYDRFDRILSIRSTNPSKSKIYACVEFDYEEKDKDTKNRNFKVVANGKILGNYNFKRYKTRFIRDFFFLDVVNDHENLLEKINYDQGFEGSNEKKKIAYYDINKGKFKDYYLKADSSRAPFVTEICNNEICQRFDYYYFNFNLLIEGETLYIKNSNDTRWNRFRTIYQTFGNESLCSNLTPSFKPLYELEYVIEDGKKDISEKKITHTHVNDLTTGSKITYHFSNGTVPQKIDYFFNSGSTKNHYSESFYFKLA